MMLQTIAMRVMVGFQGYLKENCLAVKQHSNIT